MKIFLSHSPSDGDRLGPLIHRLREGGHQIVTIEALSADLASVVPGILSADALMAFLSHDTHPVLFELGVAVGAGLPTIVIASEEANVPQDVATAPFVRLSGNPNRDAVAVLAGLDGLDRDGLRRSRVQGRDLTMAGIADDPTLVDALSAAEFEQMVGELLKARGWPVRPAGLRNGPDVDMVLTDGDGLGLVEIKKIRSQGRVSVEAVRELLAKMTLVGAHTGLLVSSAGFTSSAIAMAAGTGVILITLKQLIAGTVERPHAEDGRKDV